MRKVTAEERELFLAALSGRLPAKVVRAMAQAVAKKAVEQAPPKLFFEKPANERTRRFLAQIINH